MGERSNAEFEDILSACKAQGMDVERTGQGHFRVRRLDGKGSIIHISDSTDWHARMNIIRDLKKIGLVWPPPKKVREGKRGDSPKDEICCVQCVNIGGRPCRNTACECHEPTPIARLDALVQKPVKISNGVSVTHEWVPPPKKPQPPQPPTTPPTPTMSVEQLAKRLVELKTEYQLHTEHEVAVLQKLRALEAEVADAATARAHAYAQLAACKQAFDNVILGDLPPVPDNIKEP